MPKETHATRKKYAAKRSLGEIYLYDCVHYGQLNSDVMALRQAAVVNGLCMHITRHG